MNVEVKVYFSGIEDKIIEELNSSAKQIYIVMAWFTSERIKKALYNIQKTKQIDIKIVISKNPTNERYYFGDQAYKNLYKITKTSKGKFLHNKLIIIDNKKVITGSYNLTNKAKNNHENIVIISSKKLINNYTRIFNFLYDENYIDRNIRLLIKYKDFSKKLLSTYYNFSRNEYSKYKNKIEIGSCYSYDYGNFSIPKYSPGLIFNRSIKHMRINKSDIFDPNFISTEIKELPISKSNLINWIKSYSSINIINSYEEHPNLYHLISDEIVNSEINIDMYYKRKINYCFSVSKIEQLIHEDIDIIVEDEFWKTNFEPFLNKKIVAIIFDQFK